MHWTRTFYRTIFTSLLLTLFLASTASAQDDPIPTELFVNADPVVTENDSDLTLGLFFTVLDEERNGIADLDIESADILLEDGIRYPALVERPTTPLYIALTLDFSGSMRDSEEAMRQAAIEAINNAPEGAEIAIIRFDEEITVFPFSANRPQLQATVSNLRTEGRGTCLYDAANRAVDLVNQQAGNDPLARRAVILFTDGQDERTAGAGDTCSTSSFNQVINNASRTDTPIYTIGLLGQNGVNSNELESMAQATNGLSAIGERGNLGALFQQITDALRGQFFVQSTMFPRAGQQTATLTIETRDGQLLTTSVIFTSSRDYNPPPLPLEVLRTNLSYDQVADNFALDVTMSGTLEQISRVQLVIKGDDGTQVAQYDYDGFSPPFAFGSEGMIARDQHDIEIYAFDLDGNLLRTDRGEAILEEVRFDYRPPQEAEAEAPVVILRPISINYETLEMDLSVQVDNPDELSGFEVIVTNNETDELVETFAVDFASDPDTTISLANYTEGKYKVVVNGLNETGLPVTSSEQEITIDLPDPPGLIARLLTGFVANLWIPIAIIAVIGLVIGWMMLRSILEKRNTGTPFLQGKGIKGTSTPDLPVDRTMLDMPAVSAGQTIIQPRQGSKTALTLRVKASGDTSKIGQLVIVSKSPFTIGRDQCDLTLKDPHISRRHAEIVMQGNVHQIVDLGSSNGVFIDGQQIPPNIPTPIKSNSQIGIGQSSQLVVT